MPGYEPFLLCDFHVHTMWSDGRLSLREVVDLYGQTGRFDVIAITDHILMERDLLKRASKLMTLGRREFSVTQERFEDYLAEIAFEAKRARKMYDLLVVPGAEITQNHFRSRKNSHIIALNIKEWISADQPARNILEEIRRQGAFSIAAIRITARPDGLRSAPAFCGTTGRSWSTWWMYGKPPTGTICSR